MKLEIKLFGDLRKFGRKGKIELEVERKNIKVEDVLSMLEDRDQELADELFAGCGDLKEYFLVLVNGRRIDTLRGQETVIEKGDKIAIFPPVAGG